MAVRIGLAYNLKPEAPANPAGATSDSPHHPRSKPGAAGVSPVRSLRTDLEQPDLYAEWDEPATIDAVERALARTRRGDPPRSRRGFPRPPRRHAAGFRLQHRRRTVRPQPREPRPGDLRVPRRPCHASDPLTLGLALHKGRTKEIMALARRAHGAVRHGPTRGTTPGTCSLPFPLFAKPASRGRARASACRASAQPRASWWPRWTSCSPPTPAGAGRDVAAG